MYIYMHAVFTYSHIVACTLYVYHTGSYNTYYLCIQYGQNRCWSIPLARTQMTIQCRVTQASEVMHVHVHALYIIIIHVYTVYTCKYACQSSVNFHISVCLYDDEKRLCL